MMIEEIPALFGAQINNQTLVLCHNLEIGFGISPERGDAVNAEAPMSKDQIHLLTPQERQ
jgi:hypothetical protein